MIIGTQHNAPGYAIMIPEGPHIDECVERVLPHESGYLTNEGSAEPWPDPLPLPSGLPPVQQFDYSLLPRALQLWVKDIAERMQCPPDYVAVTAISAAGILIGRKVGIRPKRHDDWTVICNMWAIIVGRPSLMKTPAMKEAMAPVERLEIEAKKAHTEAEACYEAQKLVNEARRGLLKSNLKDATKNKADVSKIAEELAELSTNQPAPRRRFLTSSVTVEKLGELLRDNPNGIGIFSDELVGWLRSMDRDGHEADRAFYLTAWDGNNRFSFDRIGRGTTDIEAACISVVGSTQPGVLSDYMRQAVNGGRGDDSLMQRFQLAVWPDAPAGWRNVDRFPNATAKVAAFEAFSRLEKLGPDDCLAQKDKFNPDVRFLRFDEHGQTLFDEWRKNLELRLKDNALHPAMESHLAKYRSLVPSLALILHLLDGQAGPIGPKYVAAAVLWSENLEQHANRIYASVIDGSAIAARELARRITAGDVADGFTARDVYRRDWHGLSRENTELAIESLIALKWLEEREVPTAGRKKIVYAINPNVKKTAITQPTKPTDDASVGFVGGAQAHIHKLKWD